MQIVGKVSTWIQPDAEDDNLRRDSQAALRQELEWATHLSLQACILHLPPSPSSANFAYIVNQVSYVNSMKCCALLHALHSIVQVLCRV